MILLERAKSVFTKPVWFSISVISLPVLIVMLLKLETTNEWKPLVISFLAGIASSLIVVVYVWIVFEGDGNVSKTLSSINNGCVTLLERVPEAVASENTCNTVLQNIKSIESACNTLLNQCFHLIAGNRRDVESSLYDDEFERADTITIVGIACKAMLAHLCMNERGVFDGTKLKTSKLYNQLLEKPNLTVEVYFLDPNCDYVKVRAEEEDNIHNNNCREDIKKQIEVLCQLGQYLNDIKTKHRFPKGRLLVSLIDKNPYVSIFRSYGGNYEGKLYLGFLLRSHLGLDCPSISVPTSKGQQHNMMPIFDGHIGKLQDNAKRVFEWNADGAKFVAPPNFVPPANPEVQQ